MHLIVFRIGIAALLLASCAQTNMNGAPGTLAGSVMRPKTVVVSDFVFAPEVVAVDRGFTARLDRKIGSYPTHERKQRTAERVNDEIVASIIATLREAGLDAVPGSEDALSLADDAIVISGRLRAADANNAAKYNQTGFGSGRGGVVADMTVVRVSGAGKKQLFTFAAEAPSGRNAGTTGKTAAARNAAIAAALVAEKAAPEKLSTDVEAQARKLGSVAGERVAAYAKEQGWLEKTEASGSQPIENKGNIKDLGPDGKPET